MARIEEIGKPPGEEQEEKTAYCGDEFGGGFLRKPSCQDTKTQGIPKAEAVPGH